MRLGRSELEQRRNQVLSDLLDVDRQQEDGELNARDAAQLRTRYEKEALLLIRRLQDESNRAAGTAAAVGGRRRPRSRHVLYAAGVAAAVVGAVLVPAYVMDRPDGGFVTGNEALSGSSTGAATPNAGRALSTVSNKELEAVVDQNPDVVGMRLALAARYADAGRIDLATVHYTKVLEQEPDNAEALAHLGWLMLQLDRPGEAARLVGRALENEPTLADALWFQANVRLFGLDDPAGAIRTLDLMSAQGGLSVAVRGQVSRLRARAQQSLEAGR